MPFVILPTNSISGGYDVTNSLRFNSGSTDNLQRTFSSGNRKTYTLSFWIKKTAINQTNFIFQSLQDGNNFGQIYFNADQFGYESYIGSLQFQLITTQVFRDVSAWYHIVVAIDTTQATSSNRGKIYVNGSQVTSFAYSTYPSQNYDTFFNQNRTHTIGANTFSGFGNLLNGYLSDYFFIDGQALDPTSFGETDFDTGIWKPKAYTGTYGTNGFYLQFKNSASLGTDSSGNGNTFTVNNLTSIDQTTDTPTNNFATANPLDYSGIAPTLGNGNLSITTAEQSDKPFRTTIAVSKGKWYMEYKCEKSGTDGENHFGLWSAENSLTSNYVGYQLYSWGIFTSDGNKRNNQSSTSYGSAIAQNDIVMIALDKDNGKIWWGKNGTWFNSGNPASGTNEAFSNINTVVGADGFVSFCFLPQQRFSLNFGNPPYSANSYTDSAGFGNFSYQPPANYFALCTKNLSLYG
jgi:hypothetical protein